MKVGSRGDYGLRALVYLASTAAGGEPVQIHAIAERQQIPEDYLRQLLVNLRLAGLVKSVRGPHGGYMLARSPGDITMGEVLEVLEGRIERMSCRHNDEGGEACSLLAGCSIRGVWGSAVARLEETLYATSLAELATEGAAAKAPPR